MSRKILYDAEVELSDGRFLQINLDAERGWMSRPELADIRAFVLKPLVAHLPVIHVDLTPLAGGIKRRLVYFSRPHGKLGLSGDSAELCELFRLYCVGWQATVEGRNVKSLLWVYPNGVVIAADEPKYVDELIEALWKQRQSQKQGNTMP